MCLQGIVTKKCMGQSVICRPHYKGNREFAREEADVVSDLRVDGVKRSVLQRQRRQQQLGWVEGIHSMFILTVGHLSFAETRVSNFSLGVDQSLRPI